MTTTIRVPLALEHFCENLDRFGHRDVEFVVIGDRRTPGEAGAFLGRLARRSGYAIDYWDVGRQQDRLRAWPDLDRLLPWDSIQRRNLAYLIAARRCERIVTVDDDNWPGEDDFLGAHAVVGRRARLPGVATRTGWFNSVGLLDVAPHRPLYHRGFPTSRRGLDEEPTFAEVEGRVVVNAGLWTGCPDVDAMSHLDAPAESLGFADGFDGSLVVAPGTSLVFNTQNTAFHRDLLPTMFLIPMGGRIGGLEVGRHDDIWMSMFTKPVADHLGDLVAVGRPLVAQLRNEHDLYQDMLVELPALQLGNRFVDVLSGLALTGADYGSCYLEVAGALRAGCDAGAFDPDQGAYVREMVRGMETWAALAADLPDL